MGLNTRAQAPSIIPLRPLSKKTIAIHLMKSTATLRRGGKSHGLIAGSEARFF